ncbi:hypothetical protein Avbf_02888 [Armadillidium vulgare]|nr:hypothetical protein Avbf_02888 [Armadillidium vulgare]
MNYIILTTMTLLSVKWRLGNETLSDSIEVSGLESRLTLEASPSALGTYYCYISSHIRKLK